jgi:hypothetical protein
MSDDGKAGLRERLAAEIFVALSDSDQDLDLVAAEAAVRVFAAWLRDEADRLLAEDTEPAPRVHGAWALRDLADTLDPKETPQ